MQKRQTRTIPKKVEQCAHRNSTSKTCQVVHQLLGELFLVLIFDKPETNTKKTLVSANKLPEKCSNTKTNTKKKRKSKQINKSYWLERCKSRGQGN